MNTKEKGERTEAIVLAELIKRGYRVLVPFGENHRYDFVVEQGDGNFVRLQCKTGRLRGGAVKFGAQSTKTAGRRYARDYYGQADAFIVYCEEVDSLYWVPVDGSPHTEVRLRIDPSGNNQAIGVRWAKDYKI